MRKFVWQAKGSLGSYDIKANGKLEIREPQCGDVPEWKGLKVTCSCPDGQRQAAASLSQNKIIVCKHGAAALNSVLDEEAMAQHQASVNRLRRQRQEAEKQQKEREEQAKVQQEQDMPGERARIEYGLATLSDREIKQRLEESCARR